MSSNTRYYWKTYIRYARTILPLSHKAVSLYNALWALTDNAMALWYDSKNIMMHAGIGSEHTFFKVLKELLDYKLIKRTEMKQYKNIQFRKKTFVIFLIQDNKSVLDTLEKKFGHDMRKRKLASKNNANDLSRFNQK